MGNIDQNFRWLLGHINLSALPSLNFVSMHGCASFYPATLSQWPWRWVSTMSQSKLDAMNGAFDLDRWHLLDANCCAKRTNIIWREIISHTHTVIILLFWDGWGMRLELFSHVSDHQNKFYKKELSLAQN